MKSFFKKMTILVVVFLGVFFFIAEKSYAENNVCPDHKTLEQCYEDLNKQMSDLDKREKEVSQSLTNEQYRQLSLQEQINYTSRKIQESENEIKRMEIELETKNVEIRMMERDIAKTQDKIVSVQQESRKLDTAISKRLSNSYKYSFLTHIELLAQAEDLDHFLRKMKYLIETRRSDRELLTEMNNKGVVLNAEERVLGENKLDLEKARMEVENKKKDLFHERENLSAQRAEHSRLLTMSEEREKSHKATLAEIEVAQNQVTQQITALIRQMYERGEIPLDREVEKGEIIGYQGYSGFTFGAHLHLEVYNSSGIRINPFAAGYFSGGGGLGSIASSGSYHYPLASGAVTQTFHGIHPAIDLQSRSHGDQSGGTYYGAYMVCQGRVRPARQYNARGTGAPIYAITSGYVSKEQTGICGGKYVTLQHDDGGMSLYLHLR